MNAVALARVVLLVLAAALVSPAPAQDVIKLKLTHFTPPAHNHHVNVSVPWSEEIKRRTNGKVEITVFPAAALCEPQQQYDYAA